MGELKKRVPARPDDVRKLRHLALGYIAQECPDAKLGDAVAIAVTEACTNVVQHAYPGGEGDITFTAWSDGHVLNIQVEDDGVGFDVPTQNPGLGLGLELIRAHAQLDTRSEHGTTLHMRFRC